MTDDELEAALGAVLDDPGTGLSGPDGPGAVVGLVADGELRAVAARGLANLEHRAPITRDTVFHVASVSKQFAAYAVALLADEGRLSLDDPVAAHLRWFPFGDITIRQLVHHTSGLRDQWALTFLSGRRMEDVITTGDIAALVAGQRELNFPPGSQWSYSNTGYTMLGSVLAAVTGDSLREFAADRIFGPLGMTRTTFLDDHHDVIAGRADSYYGRPGGGFARIALSYSNAGATSLNTTVDDLARWVRHVTTPKVRALLGKRAVLTGGTEVPYGAGVMTVGYRGHAALAHSGGDAGYRAYLLVLPDLRLGVVVMANFAGLAARRLAERAADLLLPGAAPTGPGPARSASDAELTAWAGRYFDDDDDTVYDLVVRDGGLVLRSRTDEAMLAGGAGRFVRSGGLGDEFELVPDGIRIHPVYGAARVARRLTGATADTAAGERTGSFHSAELDAVVHVEARDDGGLWLRRTGWGTLELRPFAPGRYLASAPYLPGLGEVDVVVRFAADGSELRLGYSPARRIRFTRLAGA